MSLQRWVATIGLLCLVVHLGGCASTVDGLKKKGIEFHSGKAVKVLRF